jgi:hypothetical protein
MKQKLMNLIRSTKGVGGKQAVEWMVVLFLIGVLGGGFYYTLTEYKTAVSDTNTSRFINLMLDVIDIIPTWAKILVIVGFAGAIALVGLGIYKVLQKNTSAL